MVELSTIDPDPEKSITPTIELRTEELTENSLYALLTTEFGLSLENMAAVEITLHTAGDSGPAVTSGVTTGIRGFAHGREQTPPESLSHSHPLQEGETESLTAEFLSSEGQIGSARTVITRCARAGGEAPELTRSMATHQSGSIGKTADRLAEKTTELLVQLVVIPFGGKTVSRLWPQETLEGGPAKRFALGITVAGKGSRQSAHGLETVTDDVKRITAGLTPSTAVKTDRSIEHIARSPEQVASRLKRPDLRPEPTGLVWAGSYVARWLPRNFDWWESLSPFGLGNLPKPMVTHDELEWFLGPRPGP